MKGFDRALDAVMSIREMSEGNLYFSQDSKIPLVYVRPILSDETADEYKFRVGIRYASSSVRAKYSTLSEKLFDTAQEAADYIIALAKKENGGL